jgi:Flp pilus assembly protein TadG
MSLLSITRLSRLLREFRKDARGNVAIIFALVSIPLVALVGAAVDYTRASSARTALQTALDSAALMISKDAATMTAAQITTRARQYVDSLYVTTDAPIQTFSATYTPNTGSGATILLDAGGNIPTYFMRVMGSNFNTLPIKSSSTTTWGSTRTRVAMVLDNTGSMSDNGKMDALKSAATDMITKLSGFNSVAGDVYISIVPFAKDVNVSTQNASASWLNWTEWEAEPPVITQNNYPINVKYNSINYTWADIGPGAPCPFDTSGGSRPTQNSSVGKFSFACMDRPGTLSGAKDLSNVSPKYLIPSSGNYAGMICPGIDGGAKFPGKTSVYYNGCYTSVVDTANSIVVSTGSNASCSSNTPNCSCAGNGNNRKCTQTKYKHYWRTHPTDTAQAKDAAPAHSTWTGCVNDRDQDYDTTNDVMSGSGTPSKLPYAEQWRDCLPATITAMSNQWSDLKTQISNMTPSGNTNQAVGLFWGWQTLNTANDPYKAPAKDANWVYQDYIVVLSDGMNTQNRWSTSQSAIDTRQQTLCNNIKDPAKNGGNKITIFAIQVNINNRDPESKVLKNCAKSPTPPYFQTISQSGQTADAFNNILAQIAKLRISK